jgi:hypothetical protein
MLKAKVVLLQDVPSGLGLWLDVLEGAPSRCMLLKLRLEGIEHSFLVEGFAVGPFGPAELTVVLNPGKKAVRDALKSELTQKPEVAFELMGPPEKDWRYRP